MKEEIINIKEQLLKEYDELFNFLYQNNSLAIDSSGDDTDKVQAAFLNRMENFVNSRKVSRLKQITETLQRIENGTFGQCEDCTEQIHIKRLMFNPCIRTCVTCAEIQEISLKKK